MFWHEQVFEKSSSLRCSEIREEYTLHSRHCFCSQDFICSIGLRMNIKRIGSTIPFVLNLNFSWRSCSSVASRLPSQKPQTKGPNYFGAIAASWSTTRALSSETTRITHYHQASILLTKVIMALSLTQLFSPSYRLLQSGTDLNQTWLSTFGILSLKDGRGR